MTRRTRRRTIAVVVAAGLVAAGVAGVVLVRSRRPPVAPGAAAGRYQCPMHPQIASDAPGVCPICGMELQRVGDPFAATAERRPLFYRHPMRPDVTSPAPAKDEMGMDYIPVYPEDVAGGHETVGGRAPFTLSTERQQMIGVTRARVEPRRLELEVRAVGKVAYDPALYQAIVEYREAVHAKGHIKDSPWFEAHEGADALVRAAGLRLRQLGVSEALLRQLAGGDPVNLLLPGKSVWVYAQVYEYEVELVRPGQTLVVTAPSLPGRTFTATVAAVDPVLDPQTRTARVRALVPTPDASLRPESFVEARIRVPLGEKLAVPEDAVLDSGERQIVFVVRGEGEFEPRSVVLGQEAEGFYEVLSGLEPGEEVVTSANFLIDSESRFRAALAGFGQPAAGHAH